MSTATHVEPTPEDDGPLASIFENEVSNEPTVPRERSRSPVPERAAASSSRRVSVAELEAERTPTRRLHVIPQTICRSRYVTTLPVYGRVRRQAITRHKHPLLCAVELSLLRLWLIGFLRKNRLSISVSSKTCQVIWTTVGSPRPSNVI